MFLNILLHLLIYHLYSFEFVYPTIDLQPFTINTPSTYTFSITRSFDTLLSPTPWDTELVPASSNIVIYFPSQYTKVSEDSSNVGCNYVIIDSSLVTDPYSCTEGGNPGQKTVTISGAITSDSPIASINIQLSNVLNPSPALTTGTFVVQVGQDFSANQTGSATITLEKDSFLNCGIQFNPQEVNTTGNMEIEAEIKNGIPRGGVFEVKFPPGLNWQNDISPTHQLPIAGILVCHLIDENSSFTYIDSLYCQGDQTTQTVEVTPIFASSAVEEQITGKIKFSINDLFSPPTTEPVDIIEITSKTSENYEIDHCESTVSNLVPRAMTMSLSTTVSILYVNTYTGMRINFTTADTIQTTDYFRLQFPPDSTVNYIFKTGSMTLSTVSYDSANGFLDFYQSSSSPNINSASSEFIMFLQYRAPPSTRETNNFRFVVLTSTNYEKMEGFDTIQAIQKPYSTTVTADSYIVSEIANYEIVVELQDTLTSSAMILIVLPAQLKMGIECPTLSNSSTISSNPSCSLDGNNVTLTNINLTANDIGPQTVNIQINGIENHFASEQISPFNIYFYYTSDVVDLVGIGSDSGLTMQPTSLQIFSYQISTSLTDFHPVTYEILAGLATSTQAEGFIEVTFPPTISILSPSVSIIQHSTVSTTHSVHSSFSSPTLTISLQSLIIDKSPETNITIVINGVKNPPTTSPFNISLYTYTDTMKMINYNENYLLDGLEPNQFQSIELVSRSSEQNFATGEYMFKFITSANEIENGSTLIIDLPIQNGGNVACYNEDKTNNLACLQSNNIIKVVIDETKVSGSNGTQFSIIFTDLINPVSFQPSTFFSFTLQAPDQYLYNFDNSFIQIQNTISPDFISRTYQFTNTIYGAQLTNLNINLTMGTSANSLQLDLSQFSFTSIDCTSPSLNLTCQMSNLSLIITGTNSSQNAIASAVELTVHNLLTPLIPGNQSISIWSYHNSYLTHSKLSAIFFTPQCDNPCATCPEDNSTHCLSCYTSLSITNQIYFYLNNCYQSCPSGTYTLSINGSEVLQCGECSPNCEECSGVNSYCTSCKASPFTQIYSYKNQTENTSVCVSTCPSTTFLSNLSCLDCSSPCLQCQMQQDTCTSCFPQFYTFLPNQTSSTVLCLTVCPSDITIATTNSSNVKVCEYCQLICEKCSQEIGNCTSCYNNKYLLISENALQLQTCVSECPEGMIPINDTCQPCKSPCQTCENTTSQCLSCIQNYYLSTLDSICVETCEDFSFANVTSGQCQLCSTIPSLNCLNCSSELQCNECDDPTKPSYVYFPSNSSCLPDAPSGYINDSGIASPCINNCLQCSVQVHNCTKCEGNYNLYVSNSTGQCVINCPTFYTGVENICEACVSPCLTCDFAVDNCTSCDFNFYEYQGSCIEPENCPPYSYPNDTTQRCEDCENPCGLCENWTYCKTCRVGILNDNGECVDACPDGQISNQTSTFIDGLNVTILVCVDCLSPCSQCSVYRYNCTFCIDNYYFYASVNRCFESCPDNATVQVQYLVTNSTNPHPFVCQHCQSPCRQCEETLDNCLSCVTGLYLDILTDQCVSTCPGGYYGSQGVCIQCVNNCETCSSASECLSCSSPRSLYNFACLLTCPVTHSIIINNECKQCESGCLNCSEATSTTDSQCYSCQSPYILYKKHCILECPSDLIHYKNQTSNEYQCLTEEEYENADLPVTLQIQSLLPLPFTITGAILCIASLMSKLQNRDTYIIGMIYCWFGGLEVGSLLYVMFALYTQDTQTYEASLFTLLIIALCIVVGINLLALIIQTPYLLNDNKFSEWAREYYQKKQEQAEEGSEASEVNECCICCNNNCSFVTITIIALMISYKIKMFMFTKLFHFSGLSAPLESVQKFRIFNVFSFIGILHEGLAMYIAYHIIVEITYKSSQKLFLGCLDWMIVTMLAFIFALLLAKKDDDFFSSSTSQTDSAKDSKKDEHKNSDLQKDLIGMDSLAAIKENAHGDQDEVSLNLTEEGQIFNQKVNRPNHNIISSIRPIAVANAYWVEKEEKDSDSSPYYENEREIEKQSKVEREDAGDRRKSTLKRKEWGEVKKIVNEENILYKKKFRHKVESKRSEEGEKQIKEENKLESMATSSNPNEKVVLDQNRSFQEVLPFLHLNNQLIYKKRDSMTNIFDQNHEYEEDVDKDQVEKEIKHSSMQKEMVNKELQNDISQIQSNKIKQKAVEGQIIKNDKYKSAAENYKLPPGMNQKYEQKAGSKVLAAPLKIIEKKKELEKDGGNKQKDDDLEQINLGSEIEKEKKKEQQFAESFEREKFTRKELNQRKNQSLQQSAQNQNQHMFEQQNEQQENNIGEQSKKLFDQSEESLLKQEQKKIQELEQLEEKNQSPKRKEVGEKVYRSRKDLQVIAIENEEQINGKITQKQQKLQTIRKSIIDKRKQIKRKESQEKLKKSFQPIEKQMVKKVSKREHISLQIDLNQSNQIDQIVLPSEKSTIKKELSQKQSEKNSHHQKQQSQISQKQKIQSSEILSKKGSDGKNSIVQKSIMSKERLKYSEEEKNKQSINKEQNEQEKDSTIQLENEEIDFEKKSQNERKSIVKSSRSQKKSQNFNPIYQQAKEEEFSQGNKNQSNKTKQKVSTKQKFQIQSIKKQKQHNDEKIEEKDESKEKQENEKEEIKSSKQREESKGKKENKSEKIEYKGENSVLSLKIQQNKSYQEERKKVEENRNYEKEFPLNSFDESSLHLKKEQTQSDEKLSNPFQRSLHDNEEESASFRESSNRQSNQTQLEERQNRNIISPSQDDTLPLQNLNHNYSPVYNPITEENSQLEISENDTTRKPYDLLMEEEDFEDEELGKRDHERILKNQNEVQHDKNENLIHILNKNKLRGFRKKINKLLPQEENDEGLGLKRIAKVDFVGGTKLGFREEELKRKQKFHPLHYVEKKNEELNDQADNESIDEEQFLREKIMKNRQKSQSGQKQKIPLKIDKRQLGKVKSSIQVKNNEKMRKQIKIQNVPDYYDSQSELMRWRQKFAIPEQKKKDSAYFNESMQAPEKPFIEGYSRYKDSSREFDYEETNKSYRRGKLFDYEEVENQIEEEEGNRVKKSSRSNSKRKQMTRKNRRARTSLEKIYGQKFNKK